MAIQVLNIASQFSLSLQLRVISIPWMQRTTRVLSLKGMSYNTDSGPVRYVPKKSSRKAIERENSSPVMGFTKRVLDKNSGGIERILSLGKNAQHQEQMHAESSFLHVVGVLDEKSGGIERTLNSGKETQHQELMQAKSSFLDDEHPEGETNHYLGALDPTLVEESMDDAEEMVIQEESDTFKHNMKMSRAMQDARQLAVKLLAKRAFTAVELRKKLLGKSFPPDIVDDMITNLQCRGLIDDTLYAETFSRSRFSSSSWGPRRIMQALSSKGVCKADTDKALKLVFKEGEDHESSLSLSKHSMDQLLAKVSKQWLKSQDAPQETRKSRIVRWLQYRGFSWDVISFVLKKLESQQK